MLMLMLLYTFLSHHFRNDAMMHFNSIAVSLHAQRAAFILDVWFFFMYIEYDVHTSLCPAFFLSVSSSLLVLASRFPPYISLLLDYFWIDAFIFFIRFAFYFISFILLLSGKMVNSGVLFRSLAVIMMRSPFLSILYQL